MAPSLDDAGPRRIPAATGPSGTRPGDTQKPSFATRDGVWDPLYRPRSNPLLPHVAVRAGGAIGSGGSRFNGRGGGLSVDAGIAWNFVGIAAHGTVSAGEWGVGVDSPRVANVIGGGGLTVNMGRLALLGAGVLALSAGYDVLAMPTRRDPRLPPPVAGEIVPENRTHIPHGPRVRLDLGLLALQSRTAKVRHALGVHIGYQLLIGDLGSRGGLPAINVMSIGISYWMG